MVVLVKECELNSSLLMATSYLYQEVAIYMEQKVPFFILFKCTR